MSKHNAVESPQDLPGSLWGVTAFFNPMRFIAKLDNYMKFRAANKKQGLKLLTVELAFGNRPFQLTGKDADMLIQIKSDAILWHKEALLNIGINQLPQDCDKVVWLDADVIFTDDQWIAKTAEMLQRYKVLQLFKKVSFLNKKGKTDWNARGEICEYFTDEVCLRVNPGLAWGARREIIQKCKIYDAMVMGGGDTMFMHGLFDDLHNVLNFCGNSLLPHYKEWARQLSDETKGSFYYLDIRILHLYHGRAANRRYNLRDSWYRKYLFDPYEDIKREENGCWNFKNLEMKKLVKKYFRMRNEDDSLLFHFIYSIPFFSLESQRRFFGF